MPKDVRATFPGTNRNKPINTSGHQMLRGPESRESHRIITALRDAGFVAYLAGGCVRDALLGRQPKDYDVATNATPDSVRQVFGKSRTLAFGASFGVIGVLPPRSKEQDRRAAVEPTEVATFRSDGDYSDGRRPDSVHYGDARHDALRRDFTINGLFYDPQEDQVIDYVGGEADLEKGLLRTIGNPLERFGEDKLRMLRAVRFATTLGFKIDEATLTAINEHSDDIAVVSGERIGAEMRRVMTSEQAASGLHHLIDCGLERVVLPEIDAADVPRLERLLPHATPRHFPLILACLALVLDRPAEGITAISRRWKLSNEESRQANAALKHWPAIAQAKELRWSEVQPTLMDRDAAVALQLATAVVSAEGLDAGGIEIARDALAWPPERLDPPMLLTGDDLRDMGVPPGPRYGAILKAIRTAQLDGTIGSREEAIEMIDQC